MSERRMGLGALTDVIAPERVIGIPVGEVTGLAYDSRNVRAGTLFFAVPGVHVDGHDYAAVAVKDGAIGVVVEREMEGLDAPQLVVDRTRRALADAADAWYEQPSKELEVIGITGTDGKTTTSFLAVELLRAGGRRPGLIGTVAADIGERTNLAAQYPEKVKELETRWTREMESMKALLSQEPAPPEAPANKKGGKGKGKGKAKGKQP